MTDPDISLVSAPITTSQVEPSATAATGGNLIIIERLRRSRRYHEYSNKAVFLLTESRVKEFSSKDLFRFLQLSQIITVQFSGKNKDTKLQCAGSVTFCYGSADLYRWLTVYCYSDPDPALLFKDKKLYITKTRKAVEIKVSLHLLPVGGRIWSQIRTNN